MTTQGRSWIASILLGAGVLLSVSGCLLRSLPNRDGPPDSGAAFILPGLALIAAGVVLIIPAFRSVVREVRDARSHSEALLRSEIDERRRDGGKG